MKIGTKVGNRRWPYSAAHPGCWTRPWHGWLLSETDPRAWTNTMRFPNRTPSQAEVTDHVAWCNAQDLLDTAVPVLWQFGDETKVYWERAETLMPYRKDLAAWRAERAAAYLGCNQGQLKMAQ